MKTEIKLPGGVLTFDQHMTDEQDATARDRFMLLLRLSPVAASQLAKDVGWHWEELRK